MSAEIEGDLQVPEAYISGAHHPANLLHGVQVRRQSSVHGEDLLIDDSGDGETVETVGESLPQLDVVSSLALIVETIYTVDRSALVVTTEDEKVFGVLDLVGEKQADGL
jgi:hypothetical protein